MARVNLTNADITKWIAWGPARITEFHGMNNQNTALFIQFFTGIPNADGTWPAGSVPAVKSFQVAANQPFFFGVDVVLADCYVAISSTEVNYTAVNANGGLDMTLEFSSDFACTGNEVVVGDLVTTNHTYFSFWSNAGPYRILRIQVQDTAGVAGLVGISGTAAILATSGQYYPIAANTLLDLFFGVDGSIPNNKDSTYASISRWTAGSPPVIDNVNTFVAKAIYTV